MKIVAFLFLGMLMGLTPWTRLCAQAEIPEQGEWRGKSPDGQHLAIVRREPGSLPQRRDLDSGILEVIDRHTPGRYVRYRFSRLGWRIQWSPDSRYLVMTTVGAGGHGPWHDNAFVYFTGDRTLRGMDAVIGLVVSPLFKFTDRHTVRMAIYPSDGDFEHPKIIEFDLDQKFFSMPRERDRKESDLRPK